MPNGEKQSGTDRAGIGCAFAVLGTNSLLIGLVAASFAQGPYSSAEQELWYRYGSLGFLVGGAVLPAIALFAGRKSRWILTASVAWMVATFVAFAWYVMMSGGGV